jgi:hypothetical protein
MDTFEKNIEGINLALYTEISASRLSAARAAARSVIQSYNQDIESVTTMDIEIAYIDLIDALATLSVTDENNHRKYYEQLAQVIAQAESSNSSSYTSASLQRLQNVKADALVVLKRGTPPGAVSGAAYTSAELAAERDAVIAAILALQEALDGLETVPGYEPDPDASRELVEGGLFGAQDSIDIVYERPSAARATFTFRATNLHDAGAVHLRVSFREDDFEGLAAGAVTFSDPLIGNAAVIRDPVELTPPLLPGYKTYSIYVFAKQNEMLTIPDGTSVLDIALTLKDPLAAGHRSVFLILSNLKVSYYEDGSLSTPSTDTNISINPFVASAPLNMRSRFDVNQDGWIMLSDVNTVHQYLGRSSASGVWTSEIAGRCDLGGAAVNPGDPDGPDGTVDETDLALAIRVYEDTLL